MAIQIVKAVLTLLAGIGVFLLAVRLLSRNIEAMSGNKLRSLFSKTSKSPLLGVGLGTVTAAVIQSSGAVTVMVIGFINAGLMDLTQGAAISYGANIGTTITGQIVALGMFGENTITSTLIFTSLTGVGAFIVLFAKKDILQKIGSIIAGFGLLFVGLELMSSSMKAFTEMESLRSFIASIGNPVLLILIGTVLTALLQSSSVMSSILITMVFSGLISLDQGIYILMGANIGAGIVAILAGMGGSADAKRVSFVHLIFNVFGAVVFLIVGVIMDAASGGTVTIGTPFELIFAGAPQTQLAMFHTAYNILKVAIFLPLSKPVCKLFVKIIKEDKKERKAETPTLAFAEEHFLKTPPIAVNMVKKEIERMYGLAVINFNRSIKIVLEKAFDEKGKFVETENLLNMINRDITKYLVKIPQNMIGDRDVVFISTAYRVVSDIERIGDYAENIVEFAELLRDNDVVLSEEALGEVAIVSEKVNTLSKAVFKVFDENDMTYLPKVYSAEDDIDELTKQMSENHIRRMREGLCQPDAGAMYTELASNLERLADHFVNVAKSVKKYVPVNKG